MYSFREISKDIYWVGGSDKRLSRFENLFPLPKGVAYNAYLINDEKTAVLDSVDASISTLYINNVKKVLDNRDLDYIVVLHLEPDHSATLRELLVNYPNATVVINQVGLRIFKQFFGDICKNVQIVKEGDKLNLGKHELEFVFTPMAHWPESMMAYELSQKILFSSDAFGAFGSIDGALFDYEAGNNFDLDEYRRYYANILGKYGQRVEAAFAKLDGKAINIICPVHGHVLKDKIGLILDKYLLWAQYQSEQKGITIAYASMYGNTKDAAFLLANELAINGVTNIDLFDVSETDISYIISSIYKNTHFALLSPTYNLEIYPKMRALIDDMKMLTIRNKKAFIVGNGSWAPVVTEKISKEVSELQNVEQIVKALTIKSALDDSTAKEVRDAAKIIAEDIKNS
ncbi:MAG: FprA family A-type flavoprotein [Christensenellales bacterium]|jgi:flavorubredoxin|nr:FprA family A-type flavoprotein [Clostridiales bacterium]